jgi:C4-type Zn-finger protein
MMSLECPKCTSNKLTKENLLDEHEVLIKTFVCDTCGHMFDAYFMFDEIQEPY